MPFLAPTLFVGIGEVWAGAFVRLDVLALPQPGPPPSASADAGGGLGEEGIAPDEAADALSGVNPATAQVGNRQQLGGCHSLYAGVASWQRGTAPFGNS